jgi:hypothetical protein
MNCIAMRYRYLREFFSKLLLHDISVSIEISKGKANWIVTSCLETEFYNRLLKER